MGVLRQPSISVPALLLLGAALAVSSGCSFPSVADNASGFRHYQGTAGVAEQPSKVERQAQARVDGIAQVAHSPSASPGVTPNGTGELPDGPLSLDQLIALALDRHPEIAAAQARVEAARGKWIQAGLYPNPRVRWEADEMLHGRDGAGEQGPVFEQEFVTGGKLALAQAAAAQGILAADWQAVTRRYELTTRVRLAYYEVLTAWNELERQKEFLDRAEKSHKAAKALRDGGKVLEQDVVRAEIEVRKYENAIVQARLRSEAAWKQLALAVGVPELPVRPLRGRFDSLPPRFDWDIAARTLDYSSELQEVRALVVQSQQELLQARAAVVPNIYLKVRPFYSFPDQEGRLLVEAGVPLPVFDRNQGNIFAAQAEVARAAEEERRTALRLSERLTSARLRYENARKQVEAYEKIVPRAERALELVKTSYENQVVLDFNAVLDAQRTLAEAQLTLIAARRELWNAASELLGLLQIDDGRARR